MSKGVFNFPEEKGLSSKTGVYLIIINNHFYVGSSSNKKDGLRGRLCQHKRALENNKHHSIILQNCFNKYKEVTFKILEFCDKEDCIKREQYWIDLLNPDTNILRVAGSALGRICGEEHKRKLSEANKGKHFYNEEIIDKIRQSNLGKVMSIKTKTLISAYAKQAAKNRPKDYYDYIFKPIVQYDLEGNVVREYEKIRSVVEYGFDENSIPQCCNGNLKTLYGYVWRYKGEAFNKYNIKKNTNFFPKTSRKIYMLNNENNILKTFFSIAEAAKELNVVRASIRKCLKNNKYKCKGYYWKYAD